jgi:hypothetical protein
MIERAGDVPGRPSLKTTKHFSRAGYRKAVSGMETKHEGIATSSVVGSSVHEYESIEHGDRHLSIAGREWLGPVGLDFASASTIALQIGDRVPGGMLPISPAFLGGRLQLSAGQFEQHKVRKLKVYYEPVVPATTEGAIAIYFRNDVGNPTVYVGSSELGHAATHDAFIQTTVWNSASIDIEPSNALLKYFDTDSSEERLQVQGLVQVIAASELTFDPTGVSAEGTYGHLYLDYDVDFFTPSLDDSVPLRQRAKLNLTSSATALGGLSDGYPLRSSGVAASGTFLHTVEGLPQGVATVNELDGWMFYGTTVTDWEASLGVRALFRTGEDPTAHQYEGGVGFWVDFANGGAGVTIATYFADLNSVNEAMGSDGSDGTIDWTGTTYPQSGEVLSIVGYFVKKTNRFA